MIEAAVESHFRKRVRETGGMEWKVAWPARRGAPDRLVGWPNGRQGFVELKRPKGKAEAHQLREHDRLRTVGFRVDVLDTKEAVDAYVEEMSGRRNNPTIADVEVSVRLAAVLGLESPVSLIIEILDDDRHPLRSKLRARDLRDMQEIREVLGL